MSCDDMLLEALALGELDGPAVARAQGHLLGCSRCATELRYLRAERHGLRARSTPALKPALYGAVNRVVTGPSLRAGWFWLQPLALAAAFALAVLVSHPGSKRAAGGSCGNETRQGVEIRLAESDFNACLVATPSGAAAVSSCCY